MTVEQILKEYEKGCINTINGKPSDCPDCLDAAIRAIEEYCITPKHTRPYPYAS